MKKVNKILIVFLIAFAIFFLSKEFVREKLEENFYKNFTKLKLEPVYNRTLFNKINEQEIEEIINKYSIVDDNSLNKKSNTQNNSNLKNSINKKTSINYSKFPININKADKKSLMLIPGIGEVLASRIIEYRKKYGNFKSIKELLKIKGIGEKTLQKIKDYITVKD